MLLYSTYSKLNGPSTIDIVRTVSFGKTETDLRTVYTVLYALQVGFGFTERYSTCNINAVKVQAKWEVTN